METHRGNELTRTLFFDQSEECLKLDPDYLHIASIEPLIVMAPIKLFDNKQGAAFVGCGHDFESVVEARAWYPQNCESLNKLASD